MLRLSDWGGWRGGSSDGWRERLWRRAKAEAKEAHIYTCAAAPVQLLCSCAACELRRRQLALERLYTTVSCRAAAPDKGRDAILYDVCAACVRAMCVRACVCACVCVCVCVLCV